MSYLFKYYAGVYDSFMKKFNLDRNEEILKSLGDVGDKKILDLGGGTGTLSDLLQRKGAEVTLVDPSIEMVEKAQLKNPHLIVYGNTLQDLEGKLQKKYFDTIIIRDALHHMRKPEEAIALSHRYLKPDGEILIWEFNIKYLKAKLIWLFEFLCFERCHRFTVEKLRQLCLPYFIEEELKDERKLEILYRGRKRD